MRAEDCIQTVPCKRCDKPIALPQHRRLSYGATELEFETYDEDGEKATVFVPMPEYCSEGCRMGFQPGQWWR